MFLFVMPKYRGKQIFSLRRFPKVGRKQGKKGNKRKKKKEERPKVGNNNGQLHIANATSGGARKSAWANLQGLDLHECLMLMHFLLLLIRHLDNGWGGIWAVTDSQYHAVTQFQ